MSDMDQLSFGDGLLSSRRKVSKLTKHLDNLDQIIDWQPLVNEISVIDKTDSKTGDRPRKNSLWIKSKANLVSMRAKNAPCNRLRFLFACMAWNVSCARWEWSHREAAKRLKTVKCAAGEALAQKLKHDIHADLLEMLTMHSSIRYN